MWACTCDMVSVLTFQSKHNIENLQSCDVFLRSNKMLGFGRLMSMLVLLCGLVAWAVFVTGCSVALSETVHM